MKTNQKAFTLLEILLALAIGGILIAVLVPFIYSLLTGPPVIRSNLSALHEIGRAIRSISQDGMMAETVEASGGLTLEWVKRTENIEEPHRTEYYLSGTELIRRHYVDESDIPESTTIARYISRFEFSYSYSDQVITLLIEATLPASREQTEQRTYQIHPRPGIRS